MRSWVPGAGGSPFGIHNLPYGVFSRGGESPRAGARIGEHVVDLAALAAADRLDVASALARPTLNEFMARGPVAWRNLRAHLQHVLSDEGARTAVEPHLVPLADARLHLPFEVADYVDFYSSEYHAANLGRLFRPGQPPLPPNWRHIPIGYHGRAGTVVVSGTPVARPSGQIKPGEDPPRFGASKRLDFEAEVGFVVGVGSTPGQPVPLRDFSDHVFGVCLVNDWSARDIQAWEYVPLGPFLGKSFATSVSPWIVPLDALDAARVPPPPRDPAPLPYLDDAAEPWGLDLTLEVSLNGKHLSNPPFATMYWTAAQQLAHMTVNGASLRTGDLYASGTVSGPAADQWGSMIEMFGGSLFLADGDEVVMTASAPGPDGAVIGFGEVRGRIEPARA